MGRQCMRPGCDRPVAACLTYDTEAASVWLDGPALDGEPAQQVCATHAATLTAPLGWTLTDRRLVSADTLAEPAIQVVPDVDPEVELELDAGTEAEPGPEPATRHPAKPAANDRSGAQEPPKPRGKLLDRAFKWTGPQHSVLTTGDAAVDPEQPAESED